MNRRRKAARFGATKYEYNAQGNVTKTTDPVGRETLKEYASNGIDVIAVKQRTGTSGGLPVWTTLQTYTYAPGAPAHRPSSTTDGAGQTTAYTYTATGQVAAISNPKGADGSFEQFEYEDHSLVATRDRAGRWTRHMYNALRERVLRQHPSLRQTQSQWCRCGELRRFVDGNGNVTEWERDERSRVTKQLNADGSFTAYTYDYSGRLSTETDPMGRTLTYKYTVDDRIAKRDYSDSATADVTYAYDSWYPRITSRVDGGGTTTFAYHAHGAAILGAGQGVSRQRAANRRYAEAHV